MMLKAMETIAPTHNHRRAGSALPQGLVNWTEIYPSDLRVDPEG